MRTTKALEDDGFVGRWKLDFSSFCDTETAGKSRITQKQRCLPVRWQDPAVIELTRRFSIIRFVFSVRFTCYLRSSIKCVKMFLSRSTCRKFINVNHMRILPILLLLSDDRDSLWEYIPHEIIRKNTSRYVRSSIKIVRQLDTLGSCNESVAARLRACRKM
jgi:hypothetical protein